MSFSEEETLLLNKLSNGALDGPVGDERVYRGYRKVYCGKYIKNGIPTSYRETESTRSFNGKENEKIPGNREEEYFESDDEKLIFLQKYGWLMYDDDVREYSAKYKP